MPKLKCGSFKPPIVASLAVNILGCVPIDSAGDFGGLSMGRRLPIGTQHARCQQLKIQGAVARESSSRNLCRPRCGGYSTF